MTVKELPPPDVVNEKQIGYSIRLGYKQTEVGWIPKDWKVILLEQYAQVRSGIAKNSKKIFNDPILVPYLRVANVQDGFLDLSEVSEIAIERSNLRRFSVVDGDVLMNEGGDRDQLGRGCVWSGEFDPCVHQNHVFVVRCKAGLNPHFLTAYTGTAMAKQFFVDAGSQTTNLASINKTAIGKLPIPLPPTLAEQEAIAEALGDADSLVESLERLLAKKRHLKQAAMQQLLTGKKRLPGFEEDWEETTLGQLTRFLSGGTPSRSNDDYWKGNIPWISASSLRCFEIFRSESNVTVDAVAAGSKMAPVGATLLLVRGSALHNEILCGLVTKPVCFNQDVKALVPKSNVFPKFLTFAIRARAEEILKLVSSAGNTAGVLDTKLLKALVINLPRIDEQTAITVVLSDINVEIVAIESKIAKARQIKQGMMQELLTGQVRLI